MAVEPQADGQALDHGDDAGEGLAAAADLGGAGQAEQAGLTQGGDRGPGEDAVAVDRLGGGYDDVGDDGVEGVQMGMGHSQSSPCVRAVRGGRPVSRLRAEGRGDGGAVGPRPWSPDRATVVDRSAMAHGASPLSGRHPTAAAGLPWARVGKGSQVRSADKQEVVMGIGVSVFLIAVGAVLAFAVNVQTTGHRPGHRGLDTHGRRRYRVGHDPPALRRRRLVGSAHGGARATWSTTGRSWWRGKWSPSDRSRSRLPGVG